jgi:hypothetical protein
MSDNRWRTRLRWVVAHPHDPAVLLARPGRGPGPARDRAPGRGLDGRRGRGPPGPGRAARRRRPPAGLRRRPPGPGGRGAAGDPAGRAQGGAGPGPGDGLGGSGRPGRRRWPSSPNGAGWCWPTSARRSAGRRPWRWRRWPRPTPACRSRPPGTSAGCWPRAAWTGALTGWPPRPRPGCRRSRPPPACPASTPPPGCRPTRRPGCGRPCPDSRPFDPHSGRWRHRLAPPDPVPPLSELLDGRAGPDPRPGAGEDALAGYLRQARALLGAAGPFTPVAGPNWLPPELERLRDFHLPGDAASRRPRRPRRPRPRPGRPCR